MVGNLGLVVPELLIPLLFIVAFPLLWIAVARLLALMSRWSRLADAYPDRGQADVPEAQTFRFRSGRVGLVNYNSCLTITVCDEGLRLAVMPVFRLGNPPMFLPWNELHDVAVKKFLWIRMFQAAVGLPVAGKIQLPGWVADYYPHPLDDM